MNETTTQTTAPKTCESQQEDVVTVNVPEGHAQPQVTVNVTALDEVHERIREPQVAKLWTAEELEEIYRALPDKVKSQRLLLLLRWAVYRKCTVGLEHEIRKRLVVG
jgi:hypothetical protein